MRSINIHQQVHKINMRHNELFQVTRGTLSGITLLRWFSVYPVICLQTHAYSQNRIS